ncbi:MAG: glycosyltransferase family 39 protein [bacterium]|nr:glycosyltransferase family 39 protein [bacterium]
MILIVSAILLITFLSRIPFLRIPLDCDEGLYAYFGLGILKGLRLYRDLWDHKPPFIFLIYTFILKTIGKTPFRIRLFTGLYALLTTFSVFLLARYVYGDMVGYVSALIYGIFSSAPMHRGSGSNSETFMVFPMVLSNLLFLLYFDKGGILFLLGAGFLNGISVLIKPVALFNLGIMALFLLIKKEGLMSYIWLIGGFGLIDLMPFIYFWWKGTLSDYVSCVIKYNLRYINIIPKSRYLWRFLMFFKPIFKETCLLWIMPIIIIPFILKSYLIWVNIFLMLWLLSCFAGICVGGRFSPQYFIQIFPALSIFTGLGLVAILNLHGIGDFPYFLNLGSIALLSIYSFKSSFNFYFRYSPEEISLHQTDGINFPTGIFTYSDTVAQYIKGRTQPEERILVWDSAAQIYFLSNRLSITRFVCDSHIAGNKTYEQEILRDVEKKNPRYIVITKSLSGGREGFPALDEVINNNYIMETRINDVTIYRYKEDKRGLIEIPEKVQEETLPFYSFPQIETQSVKRILLIRSHHMTHVNQLVKDLNQRFPKASISVLAQDSVADDLKANPLINQVFLYGNGFFNLFKIDKALIKDLQNKKFHQYLKNKMQRYEIVHGLFNGIGEVNRILLIASIREKEFSHLLKEIDNKPIRPFVLLGREILEVHPNLSIGSGGMKFSFRVLRRIREEGFDMVIVPSYYYSLRTQTVAQEIFAFLSKAKYKIGFNAYMKTFYPLKIGDILFNLLRGLTQSLLRYLWYFIVIGTISLFLRISGIGYRASRD